MMFSRSFLVALVSAPFLVSAELHFTMNSTFAVVAGQPANLTWGGATSGTVTLVLRSGASSNLESGTVISSSVPDTGSYVWTPPTDTVRGSDYVLQIINNQDSSDNNYSAYFVLDSQNTVASSASSVSNPASTAMPSSTFSGASSGSMTMSSGSMTSGSMTSMTTGMTSSTSGSGAPFQTSSATGASQTSSKAGAGARATAAVGVLGAVALAAMAL